ncbi:hypothetical protein ACWDBW_01290 [Streptomyces sp. NPDC001107]
MAKQGITFRARPDAVRLDDLVTFGSEPVSELLVAARHADLDGVVPPGLQGRVPEARGLHVPRLVSDGHGTV